MERCTVCPGGIRVAFYSALFPKGGKTGAIAKDREPQKTSTLPLAIDTSKGKERRQNLCVEATELGK